MDYRIISLLISEVAFSYCLYPLNFSAKCYFQTWISFRRVCREKLLISYFRKTLKTDIIALKSSTHPLKETRSDFTGTTDWSKYQFLQIGNWFDLHAQQMWILSFDYKKGTFWLIRPRNIEIQTAEIKRTTKTLIHPINIS